MTVGDGVYNATMELHLHNESSYTLQIRLQHSLYSSERKNILLNSHVCINILE